MGDRLVSKISYNGEFFAASYQHWSASDDDMIADILDEKILEHGFFDDNHIRTKEEAAQILFETICKYNNFTDNKDYIPTCGLVKADYILDDGTNYHSDEQEALLKKGTIQLGKDRTAGLITIDKKIADYWEGWAESLNNFDFRS